MKFPFSFNQKSTVVTLSILLIWGVINGSSFIMWISISDHVLCNLGNMLKFHTMELCSVFLITLVFYKTISNLRKIKLNFFVHLMLLFVVSMIFALIMGVAHYGVKGLVWHDKWELLFSKASLYYSISQLGILFCLASVYYLIENWFALKKEREKALKASSLAQEARLQMLRYQLNPHFLFNALNSIRALIDDDQKKARYLVTELSEFLRYSLVHTKDGMVPLGKEIDAINNFFDIQKIRFEDKIKIALGIDTETRSISIPCFLVHPLAENAVKYGMQTSSTPLQIKIDATTQGNYLEIKVSNTGKLTNGHEIKPVDSNTGTGTGIQNVKQRLEHVYGNDYEFNLSENDGWVIAFIKVNFNK